MMKPFPPSTRSRGFLMLEAVVALLLFSLGLVGMIKLQARASQFSVDAEDRSRAALLANDLAATMWAQRTLSLDQATVTAWQNRVASAGSGLPNGSGRVDTSTPDLAVITITWRPPSRPASDGDHQYITKVVMP